MSTAAGDVNVVWQEKAADLARELADRIDQMFTAYWPGGSGQRKAAVEVLIRDGYINGRMPAQTIYDHRK